MDKRLFSTLMLALALASMLALAFDVRRVSAEGAIYIMADGSVEGTTHIQTFDNVTYSLDADIIGYLGIMRDNIILDGKGYMLQGFFGTAAGIGLEGRTNVTIQNVHVDNFWFGIYLRTSSNITISRCNVTASWSFAIDLEIFSNNNIIFGTSMVGNSGGVGLLFSSNHNSVCENTMTNSVGNGIVVDADFNRISGNNITANGSWGIWLNSAANNIISRNNVKNNLLGIKVDAASNITIYHNNFFGNAQQVSIMPNYINFWDHGYPSGGNYWSDYNGTDSHSGPYQNETGTDMIGDTPYIIDGNNTDRYPLMQPFVPLLGDLNLDDRVDIFDAIQVAACFGSEAGDSRWNDRADLNKDNIIDIFDLIVLAQNFGKTYP